jgi:hypothetical protein
LFDEAFVSEHYDPAEAIRACDEGMMFVTVADGLAQKLLDAEKTHQMELVADQAEVTKKQLRAETDKTRKSELRAGFAKAIRRIDCLRMLIVRVDTTDAEQAAAVAAAGVDTTDVEQAPVVAAAGVDTADAEQALVPAAPGVDSTDAEQALVSAPAGVDTTDAEQAPVMAAAGVDTTDAEQAPVMAAAAAQALWGVPAGVDAEDVFEVLKASKSVGDEFYQNQVSGDFRVGLASFVRPLGSVAEIIHLGKRGCLGPGRVTVRRVNGLPEPVSSSAAAIFRHFIKVQYRDVRSLTIQQVLKDYVEGGGTLVTTSAPDATYDAELAYWLYCAETRKPSIRLEDGRKIWVHCPQGTCFHPDALDYIGKSFCLYAAPFTFTLTGIEASARCTNEGGEKVAQAIVSAFADIPGLLVTDWPVSGVQVPEK